MTAHTLSNLLAILQVVLIVLACFYVAIIVMVIRFLAEGWLEKRLERRDRRRWEEIDREATEFHSELDDAAIDEWGRGAA